MLTAAHASISADHNSVGAPGSKFFVSDRHPCTQPQMLQNMGSDAVGGGVETSIRPGFRR